MESTQGRNRPDHDGKHRKAFDRNKAKILASQTICGICGQPVDKTLKWPHPMAPTIDHIIPIDKGGHPSDMANLQLAHWTCNRQKYNQLLGSPGKPGNQLHAEAPKDKVVSNRILPLSMDWSQYKGR